MADGWATYYPPRRRIATANKRGGGMDLHGRLTTCRRGHRFTPENTRYCTKQASGRGKRRWCVLCLLLGGHVTEAYVRRRFVAAGRAWPPPDLETGLTVVTKREDPTPPPRPSIVVVNGTASIFIEVHDNFYRTQYRTLRDRWLMAHPDRGGTAKAFIKARAALDRFIEDETTWYDAHGVKPPSVS